MKKKNHSPEQIITKLRKVEALTTQGQTVAEAARQIDVSEQTYYRWKRQYGGMRRDQLKRLKELEKENARLKKLVAELSLRTSSRRPSRESTEPVSQAGDRAACLPEP